MFNIGLHGLKAHREAMTVTGDNIANVNTVGFKGARVNFRDMLNRSMLGGASVGGGVEVSEVQRLFAQGQVTHTQVPLDFAIAGNGFFVVEGQFNGASGQFYSRAGQFRMDQNRNVVNEAGMRLQAYPFDPTTEVKSSQLSDLVVGPETMPPRATTSASMRTNLDQRVDAPATAPFDPANAEDTSNWKTSMTVYDSLGSAHELTVYFTKSAANPGEWEWNAVAEGDEIAGGNPGATVVGTGTMTFDANGALASVATPTTPLSVSWEGAATNQGIALDFGTSIADGGTGLDGLTQFATPASNASLVQDGYPPGKLEGVELDANGILQGSYSNGRSLKIAQVALARFTANEGLNRLGGNLFLETPGSGQAMIGTAGEGGGANLYGGALEQSNVDLATEFVTLIEEQRAFSAASKTVTTADEVIMETINLKR